MHGKPLKNVSQKSIIDMLTKETNGIIQNTQTQRRQKKSGRQKEK